VEGRSTEPSISGTGRHRATGRINRVYRITQSERFSQALSIEGLFGLRSCDDRALEGMRMRSPDLPEILIAAGLVACIACTVSNWLHRRKKQV
jgi:hypothetical protein